MASSNTAGSWSNNASIYDEATTEATTQKSSLDCIVECGADIECMYQCIAEVIVPSETDSGTTSLPDILKMVPDIIDGVINTLFDGATTETALEKDKDGVTTDSTVITNDENNETTTVAGNVEFSTLNEIRPLEDPTIAEEETIDADEVAMATVKGITITEEENVEADESTTVSLEEDLVVDVEVTTVTIRDQTSGDEGVEGTTNTNKDSAITENKSFEDAETTTVILKDNTITAEENIDDVEATTVTVDEFTAKIPGNPEILDQATEVNTEEVVTTLSPKEPILDTSNEATTAAGEREETALTGETVETDNGREVEKTSTTHQPSVEGDTPTNQTKMKEGKVGTDMPEGIPDRPVKEEKITVSAPSDKAKASTSDEMEEGKENDAIDVEMATISRLPTQKPIYRRSNNGSVIHNAVNSRIHFIKFDFPEKDVMLYKELVNYYMTKQMIPYIDVENNLARNIPEAVSNPRGGSLNPDTTILSWEPRQLMTKNIARNSTIPGIKLTQNIHGLIKFHMFMSMIFLTKSARHKKKHEGRKSTNSFGEKSASLQFREDMTEVHPKVVVSPATAETPSTAAALPTSPTSSPTPSPPSPLRLYSTVPCRHSSL